MVHLAYIIYFILEKIGLGSFKQENINVKNISHIFARVFRAFYVVKYMDMNGMDLLSKYIFLFTIIVT